MQLLQLVCLGEGVVKILGFCFKFNGYRIKLKLTVFEALMTLLSIDESLCFIDRAARGLILDMDLASVSYVLVSDCDWKNRRIFDGRYFWI